MIEISINTEQLLIKGHAGYAEYGKDIVCSAVSALFLTLLKSIQSFTDDKLEYSIGDNESYLKIRDLSEESKLLFDSFFIGLCMISQEYPENVSIN